MQLSNIIRAGCHGADVRAAIFEAVDSESRAERDQPAFGTPTILRPSALSGLPLRTFEDVITSGNDEQSTPFHDGATEPLLPLAAAPAPQMTTSDPAEPVALEATSTLATANQLAESIIQQAQEEAAGYLAAAQENVSRIEKDAYEAGFHHGEQAARLEVQAQVASVLTSLQQATIQLTSLRQSALQQAEADIITLAFRIASKICQHVVDDRADTITMTLQRALSHLMVDDSVCVRVNPADLTAVEAFRDDLLKELGSTQELRLIGDDTIRRGGCIVESTFGELDARIETQLEELERRFREQSHCVLENPVP